MYELIPGHQFRTRVVQECVLLFVVLVFYLKYLTLRQRYRLFLGTIRKPFPFARGLHEKGTGGPSFDQRWYRMKVIYLLFLCFASLLLQKLHFLSPSTLALDNTLSMLLLLLLQECHWHSATARYRSATILIHTLIVLVGVRPATVSTNQDV